MTQTSQSGLTAKFPPATFNSALGVAQAVNDLSGSGSPITRAMIAQKMGLSAKSGSFEKRMASARIYGMIGGKGVYQLTPAGKRYFSPANDTDKGHAMAIFMAEPPYFGQAIKNFNGKAVSAETLTEAMGGIGVPAAERSTVARSFLNSASAAGLIDANGQLHAQGGHKPGAMGSSRRGRAKPAGKKPAAKATTKKAAASGGKKAGAPAKAATPTKAAAPAKSAPSHKGASPAKATAPAKAATPAKPAAPVKAATPAKTSAPAKASSNGRRRRRRGSMAGQASGASAGRASAASAPKSASAASRPLAGQNIWTFTTGSEQVKVETSSDLSPALWQKLASYVEVLKPVR